MGTERFEGALLSALVIASLMVLAISLQYVSPISAAPEGLVPHDSIYIEGNENFTPANGGVGDSETENDPYIMENTQLIELGRAFISSFSTSLVSPLELYNESSCKGVNPVDQPIDAVPQASSADTEAEINCQLAQSVSASFSRHIMCKDKDTNWNPVDPTTIFKPNDAKAGCLMTVSVNNKIESEWYYRSDTSKSWDYYTTITSTVSPGSWHVWHAIYISGYWPGSNYPRAWKIDVHLDDSYFFSEFFEVTDGGLTEHVMCEDVVDGNPVNVKDTFIKGVDAKAHHYLRLDHVAYCSDDSHCHDGKTVWRSPDGSVYRTYIFYWSDYKDLDPNYDYWSWVYTGNDSIPIDSGTPTGTWEVKIYIDKYYNGGWEWYGPVATTSFKIRAKNNPPVLSDGCVDPENGTTDDNFTFLVKYRDQDGNPAVTRDIYVYDSGWWRFEMNHFAGTPIDGEWFYLILTGFSVGDHQFFFHFTDGIDEDYDPDTGYYWFTVEGPPLEPDIRLEYDSLSFEYPETLGYSRVEVGNVKGGDVLGYRIDCTVDFAGLVLDNDGDYTKVSSPGCNWMIETGKPILPAKTFYVLLPPSTSVKSFTVISLERVELREEHFVQLAPRPNIIGNPFSDVCLNAPPDLYPKQIFRINGIHGFRGYRLLSVTFFGAQYDPSSHKLFQINKLEVELELGRADEQNVESLFRGSPEDERILKTMVMNPDASSSYADMLTLKRTATYKYVIITSSDLVGAFQPLADWKAQKVGSATIVTTSSIAASYPGRDTQEKIRNFIIDKYANWGTEWILLGGDVEIVPYRGVYGKVEAVGGTVEDFDMPCDLYYSDLDGDWDADGDLIYGEVSDSVDLYPDVYVGRAPVNTTSEAAVFVNKVLTYEQNPPPGYLSNALLIAYWLNENTNEAALKDYIAINYLTDYTITKIYESSFGAGVDKTEVINNLNSGQGIVNHVAHGNYGETSPLYRSDVDSLNNGEKFFIFYSMACLTNKFEEVDSISEHYILNSHGGAVAYIGNSRYGWYWAGDPGEGPSDKYDKEFFKCLHDGYDHIGETLARSKITFIPQSGLDGPKRWVQYCLNLLGDPEMSIRTEWMPSKPDTVYNDGTANLEVYDITDNYAEGEPSGWLFASPTALQVPPSGSQIVTVSVNPIGLDPGTYHGWLEIISNDPDESPYTVTVTLTVKETAEWRIIETWIGTVSAPAAWQLIETWTGTVNAPAQWYLIETWIGAIEAPAAWQLIETWTGTVEAPAAWQLVETWTGTVEAPAAWQLIETWTGVVEAPAEWQLIETWTGTVEAPVAWQLIETWTGTLEAPVPDFTISVNPTSGSVQQEGGTVAIVTITSINNYSLTISLTASGQPSDVTIIFTPQSGTPTFWSTMTINVGSNAPTGDYTITITGADNKVHTCTYTLTITAVAPPPPPPPPPDTTPPPTPSLVSPTNGANITDNTPLLEWSDVSDPSGVTYDISIARDAGFVSTALQKTGLSASTYELTPAEALVDGTYYWRVRGVDGVGNIGSWSEKWSFTVYAPPAPATLTADTTPIKASVYVDNVFWGTAPQTRSVAAGSYTVSFEDYLGYLTPPPQTVTLVAGETKTVTGTYTEIPPELVENESPPIDIPSITPDENATIEVENTAITGMTIDVEENVENVRITVQQLTDKPAEIMIRAPGVIYCYLNIVSENITDADIDIVLINFRVEKSWITAENMDPDSIVMWRWDPVAEVWVSLPTARIGEDGTYHYYRAESPRLSIFGITGLILAPSPAEFELSNLVIDPSEVGPGEAVTISVAVTNVGDPVGAYTVTLEIDNVVEATENVTLAGGATETVIFTVSRDVDGTYGVKVDGLAGTFVVTLPAPTLIVPLAITGGIVLLAGTLIWLRRRKTKKERT